MTGTDVQQILFTAGQLVLWALGEVLTAGSRDARTPTPTRTGPTDKAQHVGKQDPKTPEWFGLEGTSNIIQLQPPRHRQGHPPRAQVVQNPIQPGLELFQA